VEVDTEDLEVIMVFKHTVDTGIKIIKEAEILGLGILKIEILNQLVCRLVIVVIIENLQFSDIVK
jgi:hypothetical protein